MLEQTLVNPNFLGRDSFRWFIGVVTKYVDDYPSSGFSGADWGGAKARVRIIGHHPGAKSVVPDEELPWAHVLVPLSMGTGNGGSVARGSGVGEGATVIGFFLDGDDAQQPIIIGALFQDSNINTPNSWTRGTDNFNGFKPETAPINPFNKDKETGKAPKNPAAPTPGGGVHNEKGEEKPSQGHPATEVKTIVQIPPQCKSKDTTYGKIVKALREFIKILNTVKQVGDNFINPVLNVVQDIPGTIREISTAISDAFSEYIKIIRDEIIAEIYKELEKFINDLLPKDIKIFKTLATDKIVDTIWCAFSKIIKNLAEFIFKFLFQMIGKVVNMPLCAAEAFVGSIMNTVANEIEDAIGPALQEVTSQIGGAVGSVMSYVNKALGYANQALSFLSCESAECKAIYDLEMNKGYIPKGSIEKFNSIINYSPAQGVKNLLGDAKGQFSQWIGATDPSGKSLNPDIPPEVSQAFGDCNSTSLECGLPTIEFFGGGGSGATGTAIIDAVGQVLGINITDSGSGYTSPPFISIVDSCDIGRGARAESVLNSSGGVQYVDIITPGGGYLGPEGEEPCLTNPIGEDGAEYLGTIIDVIIVSTGIGYSQDDLIYNIYCNSDVEIYPVTDDDGRIVGTTIVNGGKDIRVVPELRINTEDGQGAILRPVLGFNKVKESEIETNRRLVKKVVLCAEDHGST